MMTEITHPTAGRTVMMGVPVKLSRNPGSLRRPSPLQGQHTDEVLRELGYPPAEVARLRQKGAVR